MELHLLDILVVIAYVLIVLYIGFFVAAKKEKAATGTEEFILAGRKLTLPIFVGTLVATWYGNILGVGEFVYSSGFVAFMCFDLPYYIAAALFGFFIAKKIRTANTTTIPEQIQNHYGRKAGLISSVIILVITIPAAYILMLGIMLKLFLDVSLAAAVAIGTVISLAYLFTGGFKADVLTNSAQFVIMYIGFGALLFFAWDSFGSFSNMFSQLPESHLSLLGGNTWQYVLAWYIIAFQTFIDPSFHQRCAAAKTPQTAQRGIFLSILFWMVFDFLTLMAGFYARAFVDVADPLMSFPVLGDMVLPPFWKGIFLVALIATVMSTLDSYAFLSASTIGNDILKKWFKKVSTTTLTKIGLVITGIFGFLLAVGIPSAVDLIYKTSSIAVPGLLIPLTISFSSKYKLSPGNAIIIMLTSSLISFLWTIISEFYDFFLILQPMLAGILTALFLSPFLIRRRY
jgi:SSS family solute:Na+ symporter